MNTLQKTELTAVRHIEIFSKSEIPIYNSEAPDTAGRKTRRRRKQAIVKRYAFHANTINKAHEETFPNVLLISGPLALADLITSSRFK